MRRVLIFVFVFVFVQGFVRSFAQEKQSVFNGITIGVDLVGPVQRLASDYGTLEGALKVNLKNTYFPVVEAGLGMADTEDDNTNIKYKTSAPFLRIGLDWNVLKNKEQANRLFVGARYGISMFNYDISGPAITDPVWGGQGDFDISGISSTSHWAELVLGVQVKILKNFHMGWSARYKAKINFGGSDYCNPYYVPGYGTTESSTTWGATYHLIWDLKW